MSDEITVDQVMARRFELVEQMDVIAGRHKAELQPLAEELKVCELYIKDTMLKGGLQQIKTDAGMTYFTSKDSVTVKDMDEVIGFMLHAAPIAPAIQSAGDPQAMWDGILAHIQAHGLWGLLNRAVNKTSAKELIEAQTPPPGIEYSSYKDLAWRRGKG